VGLSQTASLDAAREDIAIITTAQSGPNVGVITSTNAMALRLLGYAKRELVGQPVSVIIPEPIASVHAEYMKNYIRTGLEVCLSPNVLLYWL
jgi:PAS domain S-box-containing protein